MTWHISRLALVTALLISCPLTATMAQTQSDDFGGSFEAGAPPPILLPAPTPAPGADGFGDEFGGSFDDAAGTTPPPPATGGGTPPPPPPPPGQPPEAAPTPGVIGGDDFDNGSFDDPTAPQPQPPQPQPPQPQPPQPQPPQPQPPQPQPPAQTGAQVPDQVTQLELQDYGVPPTSALRQGQFHAATPSIIPGGQVVTTKALADAMNSGTRMVIIDVLGNPYGLPGALLAPALAQGGTFQDRLQQQASQWLGQVTGGDSTIPIVIYCSDPMCWLSYNAALRTIAAGYDNVYWYRGGLHAWQMAGFNLQPSSF